MEEVKFNCLGKIKSGEYTNMYVKIINDEKVTGGYYLYFTNNLTDESPVFDNWCENITSVKNFLKENEVIWIGK